MNLHRYPAGSQTIVLGNNSEEYVFDKGTYQLKLCEGNKLFLHEALYALRVLRTFVSFSFDISFPF